MRFVKYSMITRSLIFFSFNKNGFILDIRSYATVYLHINNF